MFLSLSIAIYRIILSLYGFGIQIASIFHPKAKQIIEGRKLTWSKLASIDTSKKTRIWFHCASLGEFEQARPLIEAIKKANPDYFLALSFYSPSGYEVRKNYPLVDVVFYLPADTPKHAKLLIEQLKPTTVFWVKYEYWYFILSAIHQQKIPNYLTSSLFRKEQLFFSFWGKLFRKQLTFFKTIFVQDEASKTLLATIHISAIVSGDTRMDRVSTIANEAQTIDKIEQFCNNKCTIVAGSTWDIDIKHLRKAIPNSLFDSCQLIIVPHDVNESNLAFIEQQFPNQTMRFSAFNTLSKASILIVDATGFLSSIYRYGSFAYIGGGFGISVHNILEAAVYGLPTIFGPHHKKTKEATDLVQKKGAIAVANTEELNNAIFLLLDEVKRQSFSTIAANYVAENVGATAKIISQTKCI